MKTINCVHSGRSQSGTFVQHIQHAIRDLGGRGIERGCIWREQWGIEGEECWEGQGEVVHERDGTGRWNTSQYTGDREYR